MRILVLGGYGFIGSHICQHLKLEGHTIGIVDCYHQYYTFPDWEYHPVLSQRKKITNTDSGGARVFNPRAKCYHTVGWRSPAFKALKRAF